MLIRPTTGFWSTRWLDPSGSKLQVHDLNAGLDYKTLPNPKARATALSQPTGLAFSPDGKRLSNSITVLDTRKQAKVGEFFFPHDPTPTWMREARGFLYDARLSGNGTFSCASCHLSGETDGLAAITFHAVPPGQGMRLGLDIHLDLLGGAVYPISSDASGYAAAHLPIPSLTTLIGSSAWFQTIFASPCLPYRLSASPGLELTFRK